MTDAIEAQRPGEAGEYERWTLELKLAKKSTNDWFEQSRKIVRRYRDDRDAVQKDYYRLNILWANVQTLFPAVYAKCPKADVSRRFNQNDPVGRVASMIIERALNFEIEHYSDFDSAMRGSVEDMLLPGCGTAWVRYEPKTEPMVLKDGEDKPEGELLTDDMEDLERIVSERSPVDYVYWEDFLVSPARTWEEVRWVARRVYLSRDEGIERFGEDFKQVPLDHTPADLKDSSQVSKVPDTFKKAEVYEIWDKSANKVRWMTLSYHSMLDVKDDPLKLEGFFPLPKPMFATTTTGTLVPVPDYVEYQDQARELDAISDRIKMLDKAIKVVGVYNGGATEIKRMLNEGVDNQLIPVDNWAAFGDGGGIKGNVDWLPIDMIITTRQALSEERDTLIQQIYQITGISDILRGQTDPDETLGAQQIKASAGALRLKRRQKEVAQFASGLIRLKAQIVCNLYQPETLVQLSGITPQDQDYQLIPAALQLMKSEPLKTFRIEANADSMVELDEAQDQQARVQFLGAVSQFMSQAIEAANTMPEAIPLLGKMLLFGVRGFKLGRELEGDFEQMLGQIKPPPPKPNTEVEKVQAQGQIDMQIAQMKIHADSQARAAELQAKTQSDMQVAQAQAVADAQADRAKAEMQAQVDMNRDRSQAEQTTIQMQQQAAMDREKAAMQDQQHQREQAMEWQKAQLQAATAIEVAKINATKAQDDATNSATNEVKQALPAAPDFTPLTEAVNRFADAAAQMSKPRKRTIVRDKDGKATGMVEE